MRKSAIEKATVRLTQLGGQGVLVPGQIILTAAHCVRHTNEGGMALGDYYLETIETALNSFRLQVFAVEPVSDIAVLGEADNQVFEGEDAKFEAFFAKTKPVPVFRGEHEPFKEFPAYIFTHKRRWLSATARVGPKGSRSLWLRYSEKIEGGTSGGPIVNDAGELIGLVSNGQNDGHAPIPHLALPAWICRRIFPAS